MRMHREAARAARLWDEAQALGMTLEPAPGFEWICQPGGSVTPIGARKMMNAPFAFLKEHVPHMSWE